EKGRRSDKSELAVTVRGLNRKKYKGTINGCLLFSDWFNQEVDVRRNPDPVHCGPFE
ncbi:hypothetical protein J6590_102059, partial [Homalodisca vitripennis]